MQVHNIFLPVQNLTKTPINPGGLCWVLFAPWQSVDTFPDIDPQNGVINSDLIFKPGATYFTLQTSEKGRFFKEALELSNAGPFVKNEISGTMCGNNLNHITSAMAMQFNRFIVLLKERNGECRLIGNKDAGALFDYDYTSGDIFGSRLRNVKFTFESPTPVPIYNSGNIIIDTTTIPIGGGSGAGMGGTGSFDLHTRFTVGAAGSPLVGGDMVYTHAALAGKKVLVFVDGAYLPQVADPMKRYCTKVTGGNSITFFGGVADGETIEIFIY